jgi:hypothetical protein
MERSMLMTEPLHVLRVDAEVEPIAFTTVIMLV